MTFEICAKGPQQIGLTRGQSTETKGTFDTGCSTHPVTMTAVVEDLKLEIEPI